jgi:hypothetical protein
MKKTYDIIKEYEKRMKQEMEPSNLENNLSYSQDYEKFKEEQMPIFSSYEKWANFLGNIFTINIAEKDRIKVQENLNMAHLNVTASQAVVLSIVSMLLIFFFSGITLVSIFLIQGEISILSAFLGLIISMFVFYYTYTLPERLAMMWKLNASSQMVPAILYIVVYMKHTSNLERAIGFAAQHLEGPLALDFKKIFYDVEIGKYSSIKESINNYLKKWKKDAPEFLEAINLIESSLYEPTNARRIEILEKSLQVELDGVYEKMLKFSQEIRTPLTNIYMLGIILPTLGLAMLPLASALVPQMVSLSLIFTLFNLLIPFFVFYMSNQVLMKRPGGYGNASIINSEEKFEKFNSKIPMIISGIIVIPLIIVALLPFLLQLNMIESLGLQKDYRFEFLQISLFDFKEVDGELKGPYSPLAVFLSLFLPLAISLFFTISYKDKTKELIVENQRTEILESEFTNSIFQLGNRLADGIPAEIAFGKVAASTQGLETQKFFSLTNQNIQQQGMSVEEAIFNKRIGSLTQFPSPLIATSMRILLESVKKGLKIGAQSLMSISQYLKNIQKINQRLKDLLAEIVSDMRSNMTFLAPLLSGIVVGLATMITTILNKLADLKIEQQAEMGSFGGLGGIMDLFEITEIIPPYFLQIIIGLYIIEIIFILNSTLSTVNHGKDDVREKYELSNNLSRGMLLYFITSAISTLALTVLSVLILNQI